MGQNCPKSQQILSGQKGLLIIVRPRALPLLLPQIARGRRGHDSWYGEAALPSPRRVEEPSTWQATQPSPLLAELPGIPNGTDTPSCGTTLPFLGFTPEESPALRVVGPYAFTLSWYLPVFLGDPEPANCCSVL